MAKFDIESFRDYFLNLIQENLNDKILEINTEKDDDIKLCAFEEEQYTNDLNSVVMNFNEFVFYSFSDISTDSSGFGNDALNVTMTFEIVNTEREGGKLAETKIMRYTRALYEIIAENSQHPQISDLELEQFAPISINDNTNSPVMKIGGINIKGSIA